MRPSTLSLSVLLVVSIGYAAYLQIEVNRLKDAAVLVADEAGERLSKALDVEEELVGSETEGSSIEAADGAATPEVVAQAEPSAEQSRAARREERMQRMLASFEDPQMRADMVERQMNRIDGRYAEFFKTLDLNPDDLEVLRTLMAERGVVNWEMRMRRFGASNDEERESLEGERQLQREVLAQEIELLLGEDNAVALQDYTESLPFRGQVDALASSLSFTDSPLSADQGEALVASFQEVSRTFEYTNDLSEMRGRNFGNLSSDDVSTYFKEREEYDSRILEVASETLDDAQLAAYAERQLAERERAQRQIEFMMENPDGGRGGPGGGRGGPRF